MDSLAVAEGVVCSVLGIALVKAAKFLSGFRRPAPNRALKLFWIFCGLLWLAGGLILLFGFYPAFRFPPIRT